MIFIIKNNEPVLISQKKLSALTIRAFPNVGFNETDADMVAKTLVTTDHMGISTHGVLRIEQYLKRVRAGVVQAQPQIEVFDKAPSLAIIDGGAGQGQIVANRALEIAIIKAKKTGIGFISIGNSNHFGATAPYGLTATSSGVILIFGTSASPSMAPFGGHELLLGNTPIGFSVPRKGEVPFTPDMALSVAARRKMLELRDAGKPMPFGWALDTEGQPTTDPQAGLNGIIQFIGGHKGYGIALAVDILGGLLSGGRLLNNVGDMWSEKEPQGVNHISLTLNPAAILGSKIYYERMENFCSKLKASEPFENSGEVLLPGELEHRTTETRRHDGIPLASELLNTLERLAGTVP